MHLARMLQHFQEAFAQRDGLINPAYRGFTPGDKEQSVPAYPIPVEDLWTNGS
jgi:hypothetical protein